MIFNQTNFISAVLQNILMFDVAIPFIVAVSKDNRLENSFYNFFLPTSLIVSVLIFFTIIFCLTGNILQISFLETQFSKNYLLILFF